MKKGVNTDTRSKFNTVAHTMLGQSRENTSSSSQRREAKYSVDELLNQLQPSRPFKPTQEQPQLAEAFSQLEKENSMLKSRIETFETQKQAIAHQLNLAQNELIILSKAYESLQQTKEENMNLQAQVQAKDQEISSFRGRITLIERENETLKETSAELKVQTAKQSELSDLNEKLARENDSLKAAELRNKAQYNEVLRQVQEKQEVVEEERKKSKEFKKQVEVCTELQKKTKDELLANKRKLAELMREQESAKKNFVANTDTSDKEQELSAKIKDLETSKDALSTYLNEVETEKKRLAHELELVNEAKNAAQEEEEEHNMIVRQKIIRILRKLQELNENPGFEFVRDFEESLTKVEKEVEIVSNSMAQSKTLLDELHQKLEFKEEELKNAGKLVHEQRETQQSDIEVVKTAWSQDKAQYEHKVAELTGEIDRLKQNIQEVEKRVEAKQAAIREYESRLKDKEQKVLNSQEEYAKLSKKLEELQAELTESIQGRKDLVAKVQEEKDGEITQLANEKETLSYELSEATDEISALNHSIESLKDRLQGLEEINKSLDLQNDGLLKKVEAFQPMEQELQRKLRNLQTKEEHVSNAIHKLSNALATLESNLSCHSCFRILEGSVVCLPCKHVVCEQCKPSPNCPECDNVVNRTVPMSIFDEISGKVRYKKQVLDGLKQLHTSE